MAEEDPAPCDHCNGPLYRTGQDHNTTVRMHTLDCPNLRDTKADSTPSACRKCGGSGVTNAHRNEDYPCQFCKGAGSAKEEAP